MLLHESLIKKSKTFDVVKWWIGLLFVIENMKIMRHFRQYCIKYAQFSKLLLLIVVSLLCVNKWLKNIDKVSHHFLKFQSKNKWKFSEISRLQDSRISIVKERKLTSHMTHKLANMKNILWSMALQVKVVDNLEVKYGFWILIYRLFSHTAYTRNKKTWQTGSWQVNQQHLNVRN